MQRIRSVVSFVSAAVAATWSVVISTAETLPSNTSALSFVWAIITIEGAWIVGSLILVASGDLELLEGADWKQMAFVGIVFFLSGTLSLISLNGF